MHVPVLMCPINCLCNAFILKDLAFLAVTIAFNSFPPTILRHFGMQRSVSQSNQFPMDEISRKV